MGSKQQYGAISEGRARAYLEARGFVFVAANARTRYGEIDLVMRDARTLVFVEVKARHSNRAGVPAEAITSRKLAHMRQSAAAYLQENDHPGSWRLDVVSIGKDIAHLPNVTA